MEAAHDFLNFHCCFSQNTTRSSGTIKRINKARKLNTATKLESFWSISDCFGVNLRPLSVAGGWSADYKRALILPVAVLLAASCLLLNLTVLGAELNSTIGNVSLTIKAVTVMRGPEKELVSESAQRQIKLVSNSSLGEQLRPTTIKTPTTNSEPTSQLNSTTPRESTEEQQYAEPTTPDKPLDRPEVEGANEVDEDVVISSSEILDGGGKFMVGQTERPGEPISSTSANSPDASDKASPVTKGHFEGGRSPAGKVQSNVQKFANEQQYANSRLLLRLLVVGLFALVSLSLIIIYTIKLCVCQRRKRRSLLVQRNLVGDSYAVCPTSLSYEAILNCQQNIREQEEQQQQQEDQHCSCSLAGTCLRHLTAGQELRLERECLAAVGSGRSGRCCRACAIRSRQAQQEDHQLTSGAASDAAGLDSTPFTTILGFLNMARQSQQAQQGGARTRQLIGTSRASIASIHQDLTLAERFALQLTSSSASSANGLSVGASSGSCVGLAEISGSTARGAFDHAVADHYLTPWSAVGLPAPPPCSSYLGGRGGGGGGGAGGVNCSACREVLKLESGYYFAAERPPPPSYSEIYPTERERSSPPEDNLATLAASEEQQPSTDTTSANTLSNIASNRQISVVEAGAATAAPENETSACDTSEEGTLSALTIDNQTSHVVTECEGRTAWQGEQTAL